MIHNLLHELFSRRTRQTLKNREHLLQVMQSLGNPYLHYPTIHIAGTNGKGSVATKIARVLESAGYRVGLFTSPHIQNFGERIQINGVEITENEIERLLPSLLTQFPDYCFFDYTTFLAFQYFSEQNIDLAVVETGIGGLHDTTNIVQPLTSIITSVAFDHVKLLGSTLDEIAFQKAGIIKPGVPIVIGPKARLKPIFDQAKLLKSPLIEVVPQAGDYDQENQAIARAALQMLAPFFSFSASDINQGLCARPPCRFERYGRFVLDVAHNVEGFESLLKAWKIHYPNQKFVAVVGFSSDKDIDSCLKMIADQAQHLFLVSTSSKRAASLESLKKILDRAKISHFTACPSVDNGIHRALASNHDILVCGSFYIMKQVREQIFGLQVC